MNTTQEEIDYAVSVMAEVIPMLRKIYKALKKVTHTIKYKN